MINRDKDNSYFTMISNNVLNLKTISCKAKGLYSYLCSKPSNWKFSYVGICSQLMESEKQIRVMVKELVNAKLLIRYSIKDGNKFNGYEWIINPTKDDLINHKDPFNTKKQNLDSTQDGSAQDGSTQDGSAQDGSAQNGDGIRNIVFSKNDLVISNKKNINTKANLSELEISMNDFVEMRKRIKKPLTDRAKELLVKKLESMASTEMERVEILNNSIMNSWQGIFPLQKSNKIGGETTREKTQKNQYCNDDLDMDELCSRYEPGGRYDKNAQEKK